MSLKVSESIVILPKSHVSIDELFYMLLSILSEPNVYLYAKVSVQDELLILVFRLIKPGGKYQFWCFPNHSFTGRLWVQSM